jgi:sugar phosphate isomerase/epimerase
MIAYSTRLMQLGQTIGADRIIAVPSFIGPTPIARDEMIAQTAIRLLELMKLGQSLGTTVMFEPLGFHDCSIRTLGDVRELYDAAPELYEVPLVIDTFHYFITGQIPLDLDLRGLTLGLLHINDLPPVNPESPPHDRDRVMPGDGAFPLADLVQRAMAQGYDRWLSLELFNETYWSRAPGEVLELAHQKLESVFRECMGI